MVPSTVAPLIPMIPRVALFSQTITSPSTLGHSRGGVIILEEATHVDFTFLGLSKTDPPLKRDYGHESNENVDRDSVAVKEDALCQRLILLGAKWWDSEARYQFVKSVEAGQGPAIADVDWGRVEEPRLRKRRWVRVGLEGVTTTVSSVPREMHAEFDHRDEDEGVGLWVLDCDSNMHNVLEEENMVPMDAGRLGLARSMDERCRILKSLGARFYGGLEDYDGLFKGLGLEVGGRSWRVD